MKEHVSAAFSAVALGVALGVYLERFRRKHIFNDDASDPPPTVRNSTDVVKSGIDVRVDRSELERSLAVCLERSGASPPHASLAAHVLVSADCRGIPSHGSNRAEIYSAELRAGLIDGGAVPKIDRETESTANVDGRNGLGAVVSRFAMDLCVKKAKNGGVGLVVCHNSNHFGIAGYWAEMALREGLIGLSFTNTSPFMVPTRGRVRAGGTNPIACYCPAGEEDSFQLDMASTTVPVGKVEVCHRKGQRMPLGWGVDASGTKSSTDPTEVMLQGGLTPLGGMEETAGYKGYGLNMMIEILCAVLSGCEKVGPDVQPWNISRKLPIDYGHCFLCVDPEKFIPGGGFQEKLAAYLLCMRNLPTAEAGLSVLVPGDPERQEELLAEANGVRLNENVALSVRSLARELGCDDTLPLEISRLPESKHTVKHLGATH